MWSAISSVIALVLVAGLNIGLMAAAGGALTPTGQVMTTALWALQAPIAAILINARSARTEGVAAAGTVMRSTETTGESVLALVIVSVIAVFVAMQLATFVFAGITFVKDYLLQSLCALGHADRCAQIPQDAPGAGYVAVLVGGGMFSILVGLIGFGVAAYRIGWRARRLGLLGALVVPPLVVILLFAENLLSLAVVGAGGDSILTQMDPLTLALARAPIALVGLVPAAIGYLLSRRLNPVVRRYARSVARASGKRSRFSPAKMKAEFLSVLGFSSSEHELLIRRRPAAEDGAPAREAKI